MFRRRSGLTYLSQDQALHPDGAERLFVTPAVYRNVAIRIGTRLLRGGFWAAYTNNCCGRESRRKQCEIVECVVTGASGFVGQALTRALALPRGITVLRLAAATSPAAEGVAFSNARKNPTNSRAFAQARLCHTFGGEAACFFRTRLT